MIRASEGNQMPSSPRQYQRIAPFYDLLELPFEYARYRRLRRLVFDGLCDIPLLSQATRAERMDQDKTKQNERRTVIWAILVLSLVFLGVGFLFP